MSHPVVVVHRGWHEEFPENSLPAFKAAWKSGIAWCECDVHFSLDGQAVVLHDETLERTTTGHGPVHLQSLRELRSFKLCEMNGTATSYAIPTMTELLAVMRPVDRLLVEIKAMGEPHDAIRLLEMLPAGKCMIQSFDRELLEAISDVRVEIPRAWLIGEEGDLWAALASPFPAIHLNFQRIDATAVHTLRQQGKQIGAWTVNEEGNVLRMLELGVDMIISDRPQHVLEIIEKHFTP